MKKIIVLIYFTSILISCSSSNDSVSDMSETTGGNDTFSGSFVSGAHPTSGTVSVNSNKTKLTFTNFKTDDGPELFVYLSTEIGSSDYVSLGSLKGIDGDYMYDIPNNTDLIKNNIVDIWCVAASVSFGHAELK